MTTNNWLNYYPSTFFRYPFLLLNWQRTVFGSWLDIWAKTTPTVLSGTGKTLSVQEQFISNFLEIEEKAIQKSLDTQKMFWDNYFKVMKRQKYQIKDQASEKTATLEPFPTSANLEPFPVSANISN